MTVRRLSLIATAVLLLGAALAGSLLIASTDTETSQPHKTWAIDPRDDRRLVGWADHVFMARVVEQTGTTEIDPLVYDQYRVKVLRSLKGSLPGTATVSSEAQGDKLTSGRVYVFVSRTDETYGWQMTVDDFGEIPVRDAQHETELLQRFDNAVREQIPFDNGMPRRDPEAQP